MGYSFTSIANQKSVRYSVSISYFTNIAVQNVNKVRACAQEWTSSLNVWLEFLSKGTFAPPPLLKGKGGCNAPPAPPFAVSLEITTTELCTYQCFPPERGGGWWVEAIQGNFDIFKILYSNSVGQGKAVKIPHSRPQISR
jgi:hypothetical protein